MLEAAYAQIAHRRIISEEDASKTTDQLGDALKKYKDKIAEVEDLYKKASSPNATPEDLEAANKALSELNGQKSAPAAPAQPTAAPASTPQAPTTTAPNAQSAEEKAKSMMDANGNSPVVSTPKQPVAPAPQPAAAPVVAPKPVAPATQQKTPTAVPTQPQFRANPQIQKVAPTGTYTPPSQDELTKFRRETGTNFNPNSVNDKLSLQRMRQGQETFNSKQANTYRKANPSWKPGTNV